MKRFPTLFVSHGAPDYALVPGVAGAQLSAAALELPRPKAVLIISPHWTTRELRVSSATRPATIHDFGGFDPALYDLQYPANGHPSLAQRALDLLKEAGWPVAADQHRGLDHGAWVPLRYLYPDADVSVFQVSMPADLQAASAFALGRALAPLADEGVLIVGSGSLTHNLYEFRHAQTEEAAYAQEFTAWIRKVLQEGNTARLTNALTLAPHAQRAHPTSEHFLPLLIAFAAAQAALPMTVLPGSITHGVLSMESYVFGRALSLETTGVEAAIPGGSLALI